MGKPTWWKGEPGQCMLEAVCGLLMQLPSEGPKGVSDSDLEQFFVGWDQDNSGAIDLTELMEFLKRPVQQIGRRASSIKPPPARTTMSDDQAASRIAAGMKGMHVRRELARGNSDRFLDPTRDEKLGERRARTAHPRLYKLHRYGVRSACG